jgi:hypothetical protein
MSAGRIAGRRCSLLSRHKARLVLGLKAGGVSSAHVEATLLALHPGATPPRA